MIIDSISNAGMYFCLGSGIRAALEFFCAYDGALHEPGDIRLNGDVLIKRWTYTTAAIKPKRLEAHRSFVDVMFIADGEEMLYWLPKSAAAEPQDGYDEGADVIFADMYDGASCCKLCKEQFAILLPQDYHNAGAAWRQETEVKKLIAKVGIGTVGDFEYLRFGLKK